MPNDKLVAALRETRDDLVRDEKSDRVHRLDKAREILKEAEHNVACARDHEKSAIEADEDIQDKLRVLEGLIEKPHYLIDKIGRLQTEQQETKRAREKAKEMVDQRVRECKAAQHVVTAAEIAVAAIFKDIEDIDSKISEAQG